MIHTILKRIRNARLLYNQSLITIVDRDYVGRLPVYDVAVKSKDHFFLCDGVLVHNTAWTVKNKLGLDIKEAEELFRQHAALFPQIRMWQDRIKKEALFTGEIKTIYGWTLKVKNWVQSRDQKIRDYGVRRAWNIIQAMFAIGSTRLGHVKLFNLIWKPPTGEVSGSGLQVGKYYGSGIKGLITTHDEWVFSVPKAILWDFAKDLYLLIRSTTKPGAPVPLEGDFEIGYRYAELVSIGYTKEDGKITGFFVDSEKEDELPELENENIIEDEDYDNFGVDY